MSLCLWVSVSVYACISSFCTCLSASVFISLPDLVFGCEPSKFLQRWHLLCGFTGFGDSAPRFSVILRPITSRTVSVRLMSLGASSRPRCDFLSHLDSLARFSLPLCLLHFASQSAYLLSLSLCWPILSISLWRSTRSLWWPTFSLSLSLCWRIFFFSLSLVAYVLTRCLRSHSLLPCVFFSLSLSFCPCWRLSQHYVSDNSTNLVLQNVLGKLCGSAPYAAAPRTLKPALRPG